MIAIHYLVFSSFVLTALLGSIILPWFVAITLMALIGRVITSQEECPLTTLENYIRGKLKLKSSKGFLKDYILHPKQTFNNIYKELKNE